MNKKMLAAAVLAAALVVGSGGVAHSLSQAEWSTRYWAWAYGLNPDTMWQVALCESSGNPGAVGPDSSEGRPQGLFQWKGQTWAALQQLELADTALAPNLSRYDPEWRSAWDADAAAHLAAWSFAHGYRGLWACGWTVG